MLNIDFEHFLIKLAHDKRASLICSILLGIILGWTLLSFFSLFFPGSFQKKEGNAAQIKVEKIDVAQYHLFGLFQEAILPTTSEAPMNLSLQAIFYTENTPQKSSALISENNNIAKLYYINDRLPNGSTVLQIAPDKVILESGGTHQVLTLPIPKLEFGLPPENTF